MDTDTKFRLSKFNLRVANTSYADAFDNKAAAYLRDLPKQTPKEIKKRNQSATSSMSTFALEL